MSADTGADGVCGSGEGVAGPEFLVIRQSGMDVVVKRRK